MKASWTYLQSGLGLAAPDRQDQCGAGLGNRPSSQRSGQPQPGIQAHLTVVTAVTLSSL